jgi:drug/metabolite transporter (DMT)-like permease
VVLGIGLLAISFGAILARLAQGHGLPSLAIATLRLGLAALFITPIALWQSGRTLRTLSRATGPADLRRRFFPRAALRDLDHLARIHFGGQQHGARDDQPAVDRHRVVRPLRGKAQPVMLVGIVISLSGSLLIFWSDSQQQRPPAAIRCSATAWPLSAAGVFPPIY